MSKTAKSRSQTGPGKRLVIVESPTKAKTIRRFLPGTGYQVEASMGHVRDLPAKADEIPKAHKGEAWARLGIKIEDSFEPLYIIPPAKKKVVNALRQALKGATELYIATDEDREGESIGWHLLQVLAPNIPVRRMVFHEITEAAIVRALEETRDIDGDLVEAQETRRILDRLVGYTISPLLWKKIAPKLSAGRVQSVAMRLLVLREKERIAFRPADYWDLKAQLGQETKSRPFEAVMTHLADVRLASGRDFDDDTGKLKKNLTEGKDVLLLKEARARQLAGLLKPLPWRVTSIEERQATRSPAPPFTTSTLQQEASRKLNLPAKRTMQVAQKLYENGYITYMRTDSVNLSQEAISACRRAVEGRYGKPYLSDKPRRYKGKSRNAQEAHEAIRPSGSDMKTRDDHGLGGTEGALYDLIWKRTVATQMADARLRFVTARIEAGQGEDKAEFRASGRTTEFAGFFRAYVEGSDDPDAVLDSQEQPLPDLKEGDVLSCNDVDALGHQTKPPARYTEASLVKTLEKEGIGRPSTYASIIDTIITRGYVRKQSSQLVPTFTAFATNNLLETQFNRLVDVHFTAEMEQVLDDIASGDKDPTPFLKRFYSGDDGIETKVEEGLEQIDGRDISTLSFPEWGDYIVRVGRYGPYVEGTIDGETVTASVPEELAPAEVTAEKLEELLRAGNADDRVLGSFPDTGQDMLLKRGPYGPYLQLGYDEEAQQGKKKSKPKRISVPKGVNPGDIDKETARQLLSLPRTLGEHPDTGAPIQAHIGRFGPYVRHSSTYASLGKDDSLLDVGYDRALELIQKKEAKNRPLRILGDHPDSGKPVEIRDGRYGPYVKHGRTNASLTEDQSVEALSLQDALAMLEAKGDKTKSKGKKSGGKKKAASKKPKATPADLEPFLGELDDDVADVVRRMEGMDGRKAQDAETLADILDLPTEDIEAKHKRGMFKLRMAYGKARKEQDGDEAKKSSSKSASKSAAKSAKSSRTSKKKSSAKSSTKSRKSSGPKATPKELEPFLSELDDDVAEVVKRVEGMGAHKPHDTAMVAQELSTPEEDVKAKHKRGMFKLRMAYGKARKQQGDSGAAQAA
ncbi:MAG: type I DNA topoisomerase [Trueperaceae bacterium]|nr:type I DNA topoisomerase [Trueperaceae bacterium]